MRATVFSTSLVVALLTAAPVLADPATPEGAQALSQTTAAYFGKAAVDKGVIAITPRGESYLVAIDLQQMVDAFKLPPDVRLTGRWSLVLTPITDGAWNVSIDDFPTTVLEKGADARRFSFSMSAKGFHFDGVFDPGLGWFRNSRTNADSFDFKTRAVERLTGLPIEYASHHGATTASTTGVAASGGGVTIGFREQIDGSRRSISLPTGVAKEASSDYFIATAADHYDIGLLVGEGSIDGLRAARLGDLWRFLVAHAEHRDAEPAAFQSGLKARVLATLPLWDRIATTAAIHDVTMNMREGKIAMKSIAETVAMSGVNAQGSFEFGVKIGDLGVESPIVPAWAAPLTPTAVDLDMTLSAAGIDKIVRLAIDDFDIGATPPLPAESITKMKAMLTGGDPKLTAAHGHLTSPTLDLAFQGALALTPPKPTGKLEIAADSLDKTLAILGKAAEGNPGLQKALLGVTFLKGLAKPDADGKLTWEIALGDDGAVTINGAPMPKGK